MKLAVIADIHGNAPALRAFLREVDRRRDVEHIYVLGDMVGIGPDTNEVLDALFSRNDVSLVTGNHDEAVLALIRGEGYPESHSHVRVHHKWIADRMDPSFRRRLEQLPRTILRTLEGTSFRFTHYSLVKGKERAPIAGEPFAPIVKPTRENLEALFKDSREDVICFGHDHPLLCLRGGKAVYLNPGSLGCGEKPSAPYAIVEVGKGSVDIRLEEADYDKADFLRSYERLKVPDREFILQVFHGYPGRVR
ncbi:metallophosphoesterase family protein [Gorillibacterium timonense]|uniref:metallophosphoesterase family protein n=1 Tax=Gorillibacterium timonense TaxID=1689269 RepID=UPI00071D7EE8|nr:metallophosphoesterase family protein [Gorillibacterium timonense]